MKFSIVTPSFRNSSWLRLCIGSVADQQGVELEHIVQDAGSDDETPDWLPHDPRVQAYIEKDAGMYDAINRGYGRATGDILAYLNCDEQYLPGALAGVADFFSANPEVDVAFGGVIVVDENGQYLCHRHSLVPHPHGIWFRFGVLTSSIFLRRSVVQERGLLFDTGWRALGDLHWVSALIKHRVAMRVLDGFQSTFTDTGDNLGLSPAAVREYQKTLAMTPRWVRALRPFWIAHHTLRRLAAGHFSLKPTSYSIYTLQSPGRRARFEVPKPTALWRNRR
jgi:glycosyltransferase involved in cell wall biosynthesis